MKIPKIKVTRLLVLMALCSALFVGNLILPSQTAEAATKKTSISATKMTIPIGKMDNKVYWNINSYELSNAQKLSVNNKVKGATYKFTSSNTKVVQINKDGGYLTGLKAGSATITCTQTYKSKNTTVGKCTVTVKNAAITTSEYENVFAVGNGGYDLSYYYAGLEPLFNITYRNLNATYTLTSDSKDFSIKEIKYDASKVKDLSVSEEYKTVIKDYIGDRYIYGYQFTAKKAGTYTVTVKETFNKKTKTMGSFKVEIKDTSIPESNVDLLLGDYLNVFSLLNYTKEGTIYYFNIENYDEANPDNNVLDLIQNESELYIYAKKTGTATVAITEGSEQGTMIGTVTITVAEAPCQGITVEDEYTAYVGDDYFSIYYELDPWNTTDKVTVESDNPDVLKVEYDEEYEYWTYSPLKAGEANVTIKCGDQSVVTKVVVEEW